MGAARPKTPTYEPGPLIGLAFLFDPARRAFSLACRRHKRNSLVGRRDHPPFGIPTPIGAALAMRCYRTSAPLLAIGMCAAGFGGGIYCTVGLSSAGWESKLRIVLARMGNRSWAG